MIIVDFHQIMFATIMASPNKDQNIVRHMVLNSLRNINKKFRDEYGNMIIAVDTGSSWRRAVFPYYKANRRHHTEDTDFDWEEFFDSVDMVKSEILNVVPYKVIAVDTAEGDDVIGTITLAYRDTHKIMIVSGDKDFIQLHNENVKQFNPVLKKYVKTDQSPEDYLLEHILRGDASDGIPNILSDDDTFVSECKRQRPLRRKRIDTWNDTKTFATANETERFARNSVLIDLKCVPEIIQNEVMRIFDEEHDDSIQPLEDYLNNNNLKQLMQSIGDFS